jgi:hypothetical protein
MRQVTLLQLATVKDPAARNALQELERASKDSDIVTLSNAFTVSNFTIQRTLDGSTATLTDVINVLGTLISDFQKGGANRTV